MARYMLHNILIIVILCVAILFLSGIALPRLFTKQYLELRSELNAHSEDLKLNYKVNSNSTSTVEDFGNVSFVKSATVWKNVSTKLQKKDLSTDVTFLKHAEKIKRRKKRQVYSKSIDKIFAWNFNLNVSRYENNTPVTLNETQSAQNESNYLGMAVYVEGKGPKRTYRELENAWSSVGDFIKRLFGDDIERLPPKLENQKNEAVFAISGSLQTQPDSEATQMSNIEKFNNEGSGDVSQSPNGREGRFIFLNFLGFGAKSLDKTTEFSESENIAKTTNPTLTLDKTQIDNNFRNDVNPMNEVLEKSKIVTESNEKVVFQSETNSNVSPTKFTSITKFNASKTSDENKVPTIFESNEVTHTNECFDCEIDSFEVSNPNKEEELENTSVTTVESNTMFTNEELETYCMDLVNQLEESQRFLSAISNTSDLQDGKFKEGDQLSSVRGPEMFDLFSLFSALQQSKLNSNSDIIEDSFLVDESTISPITDEPKLNQSRESRFFNLNMLGFGSGRSALDETNDLTSDNLNSDTEEIENFPSIQNCESYFRKKQIIKMFPKPNLMDIISDPNIKLTDFNNGSISLKLKEQQLQFLTDRLKESMNNSSLVSDVNSENELNTPHSSETNALSESFSTNSKNPKIEESIKENETVEHDFNLSDNDMVGNKIHTEVQHVTEIPRDGRFFGFLGFGSGNGGSEDESTERGGRFFIGSFFGSGERSFKSMDAINESNTQLLENEDSLQENVFFSGDSRIIDSGTDAQPDFTASTSGQERRFWGLLGLSGSGSERQLHEGMELIQTPATPFVEDECGNDCSFEIHNTTEIDHDCNECNIHNSQNDESEGQNCFDCLDYSLFNESSISETVINTPVDQNDENSTLMYNYQYDNCSDCSRVEYENIENDYFPKNVSFECDDCGTDGKLSNHYGDSNSKEIEKPCQDDCGDIFTFSKKSEILNDSFIWTTENIFQNNTVHDYNFKNCSNCYHEPAIDSPSKRNLTFKECDDCDFNVEIETYGDSINSTQTDTEPIHETLPSYSHQINETDCNDCNYEIDEPLNSNTVTHEMLLTDKEYVNLNIKDLNTFTELLNTDESDIKTEKSRLFLGPIFLTGSGDGGLFSDSEGPINLVEEGTVKPPDGSIPRGSRLNDVENTSINQLVKSTVTPIKRKGRVEDSDNMKENVESGKVFPEETTLNQPILPPNRRGRLDDETSLDQSRLKVRVKDNPIVSTFSPVSSTDHEAMTTQSFKQNRATNSTTESTTFSSEVISSISEVSSTIFRITNPEPRFCTSASECNIELNEGCVRSSLSSICGCRRQFVRRKETGECVAKSMVKASLKLPAEEFDEDLANRLSPRFKDMSAKASKTMMLLLRKTPDLLPILAGLDVTEFGPGSLIVNWDLELAAGNESEVEFLQYVENGIKKALADDVLIEKAPLDVRNASVLSISSYLDACKSMELNYCSKNAYCFRSAAFPGFVCRCKDDYFDVSSSKQYPGEMCEALCPSDYCGDHGHCEYIGNEGKRCLCSGWHFGDRCEISGVVVVASFSVNLFLIITGIFIAVVCRRRCRKSSYAAPQGFRRSEEIGMTVTSPTRVSDVIALEENIGARMGTFQLISTPVPDPPVIKVTKPTLNESSISYDYDSTFDRTTSVPDRTVSVQDSAIQTPSGKNVVVPETQSTI